MVLGLCENRLERFFSQETLRLGMFYTQTSISRANESISAVCGPILLRLGYVTVPDVF